MPFILALLQSVCMILLLFRFHSLCGSIQQLFSTNHTSAFFPHPLFFSLCSLFLIHSYITDSTATQSFHRTCALPHYNLFASICIPLDFLTQGILLLSLPRSILPRSLSLCLCSCLPVSFISVPYCFLLSPSQFFMPLLVVFFPPAKSCNEA